MAKEPNFLLGRGERLTKGVPYHSGFGTSPPPYSWDEQRLYLQKQISDQQAYMENLPTDACPDDQVVSQLTLHPQYYSRSAFPEKMLANTQLRFIGSKPAIVRPRAGRGSELQAGVTTTTMFIAGKRSAFKALSRSIRSVNEGDQLAIELQKIETIRPMTERTRIAGKIPSRDVPLELVIHFDVDVDLDWEDEFFDFARQSGVKINSKLQYQTRGLWFMAAHGNHEAVNQLAKFSFVRTVRPMPVMRTVDIPHRMRSVRASASIMLPEEDAVDPNNPIAIFDGGLPSNHPFGKFARAIEPAPADSIGNAIPELQAHGVAVTSAALFGSVRSHQLARPFCTVDHYRVLGDGVDGEKLYTTMLYVEKVLSSSNYEFVSLSMGPAEVVGDDKVTAWTAMLDDYFQQGTTLGAIAVGNDGDEEAPHNRVQVPSDCVNAVAVGSSNGRSARWSRAEYSSVGPGRAPGAVKPDVVMPGGVEGNEFRFVFPNGKLGLDCGTSYSTPDLIRVGAGIRSHFGRDISILGVRALLIHSAEQNGNPRNEVGWGMPPDDLSELTVCADGSVRVLYQGFIDPSKVIRAEIPMPSSEILGRVKVRATFCYVCETDPHTPGDYTRAGLEIHFRPDKTKLPKPVGGRRPNPDFAATKSFFEGVGRRTEQAQRADGFKWDTVRHAEHRFNATTLNDPTFDIHYIARQPGSKDTPSAARKLPYALVVTVSADKHPTFYNEVVARYGGILEVIRPRIGLPTRV